MFFNSAALLLFCATAVSIPTAILSDNSDGTPLLNDEVQCGLYKQTSVNCRPSLSPGQSGNADCNCRTSSDCCAWNSTDFGVVQSCGGFTGPLWCSCTTPGNTCGGGYRCCDGSICKDKCPPAAKFQYCQTGKKDNCQKGLSCTVDSVSLRIFGGHARPYEDRGRCL